MHLYDIALEMRDILDERRDKIELEFFETDHIYYMLDVNGEKRNDFLSVSGIIKKYAPEFDRDYWLDYKSMGDSIKRQQLSDKWDYERDYSAWKGSRVHFELEKELVRRYSSYKEVREPEFEIVGNILEESNVMIGGGINYLDLMEQRGAVLLDTEVVMGDPEEGYVGQADKVWLMNNKTNTGYGFVITDWKSNKPEKMENTYDNGYMYGPFSMIKDSTKSHYEVQLPLYGRLLLKMFKGTKYEKVPVLGCIFVHLLPDGSFKEYRISSELMKYIFNVDLKLK